MNSPYTKNMREKSFVDNDPKQLKPSMKSYTNPLRQQLPNLY